MANIWMHNGFLQVEGQKMSKSLGNFITIHELLHTDKFGGRKWPGEVLRLAMLKTHYRQPIDWTQRGLEEASANLRAMLAVLQFPDTEYNQAASDRLEAEVISAISDDLNTVRAIGLLLEGATDLKPGKLGELFNLLGIDLARYELLEKERLKLTDESKSLVDELVTARLDARTAKNWAESDRIRDVLAKMGIAIKDNKDGTTSWEVKR